MLSRIDGHTPWAILRDIGGLLPEEADLALEGWLQTGLVLLDEASARAKPAPEIAAPPLPPRGFGSPAPRAPDLSRVDPSLDLDADLQTRILTFEARLPHASVHEILGVGRDSEPREIKRAYFQLSKQFHPDRYFRRNIGHHALRLDRIFKQVALAYELLSDPASRSEIERSMESGPGPEEGAHRRSAPGQRESLGPDGEPPGGYRTPSRMENLERLRSRFKMPKKVLAERRFKARQFFDASRAAAHEKRWLEAAASARLAIAFDPWNLEYREQFASIQADVHAARANELLEQAEGAGARADALKLLEEAIHYRPVDAALQARAAGLALETGDLERAREYAEGACELEPEEAANPLLLFRVLHRAGDRAGAQRALNAAGKLAPEDPDVVAAQRSLRAGKMKSSGGTR